MDLNKLVLDKIAAIGDEAAQKYFDVSAGTVSAWKLGRTAPKLAAAQKVMDELPPPVTAPAISAPEEVWEEPVNKTGTVTLLMPMMEGIGAVSFTTLVRACKDYGMDRVSIIPKWRTLIVEARNDLADSFLKTSAEWCIFIDADMVFPCGSGPLLHKLGLSLPEPKASRNFIARLMSHPADKLIVGALYKDRRGGVRAQCEAGFRSTDDNTRLLSLFTSEPTIYSDGLEEAGWFGFASVRIHRSVFERMKEAAKEGGPLAEIAPAREGEAYGFFETSRAIRGEDVSYCRRAAKIGIQSWLDTGTLLGHCGSKIY
jgi:hypothetical protein